MGEWHQHKLADLGQIVTGKTPPTSNPDFYGGNVPFVTPTDMDLRRTIDCTLRNLSELGAKKVKSSYIKNPAIVVSCIGSDMGKAALVDKPFVSNQQINSVIVRESFDRLFVYYNLSARKTEIRANANGAAQPIMNKTDFGNLTINVPDLDIQQAISCVLSALDDKIELNRRMNATLEGLARALFADWFVDFGPTRAKMALSAKGAKNAQTKPYLAPDLWSLFPDSLNDKGVPEGWEEKPLSELGEIVTGKTPSTKVNEYFGNEVSFLKIPDMHGKMYVLETKTMLSRLGADTQNKKYLPAGSVSVSCIATPGLVTLNHCQRQTNQQINSIVPFEEYPSEYIYWSCKMLASELTTGGSGGSVFHNMNKSTFSALKIIYPGEHVVKEYIATVQGLHTQILQNKLESRTLAQTRDLLLPKLMSGEIRVGEAEKPVEDAG